MRLDVILIGAGTLATSALLTGVVRKLAVAHGVLDIPNERSSHSGATPRGGGAAIVFAVTVAFGLLAVFGVMRSDFLLALEVGGLAVATVGFIDDRGKVPPGIRLVVHLAAASWAMYWLGSLPPLLVAGYVLKLGWIGQLLGVLAIVWTLNLCNFMDGIDGIAASEAAFVAFAGAWLSSRGGTEPQVAAAAWVFGAACVGFLLWNWPPARIFMGDVGSGYLGYVIGVLALAASRENPAALWVWLILGGVFFVDATVTLARRLLRGERVYEAHRSHAYQWLARRWGSHKSVTNTVVAVNVLWLLPCAIFSAYHPHWGLHMVLVALTPLGIAALGAGAGRRENG
jgi:Fuc2NAc and GlcNAc transferase